MSLGNNVLSWRVLSSSTSITVAVRTSNPTLPYPVCHSLTFVTWYLILWQAFYILLSLPISTSLVSIPTLSLFSFEYLPSLLIVIFSFYAINGICCYPCLTHPHSFVSLILPTCHALFLLSRLALHFLFWIFFFMSYCSVETLFVSL
jgi:hypothetical protein